MSDKTMREQFEEWYAKSYCPDVTAEHRMQRNYSWAAWQAALAQREAQEPVALDCYDAGLLNDFGGGNVEWWQDYMRAELARAHEFYQSQMPHQSAGDAWSDGYKHAHYEFGAALRSLEQILSRKPLDIPGALMVIKSQRSVIAAHEAKKGGAS